MYYTSSDAAVCMCWQVLRRSSTIYTHWHTMCVQHKRAGVFMCLRDRCTCIIVANPSIRYAQMTHRDGSFEDGTSECLPEQCLLLETLSRKVPRPGVTGTDVCSEHCIIFICVAKDTLRDV